MPIPTRSMSLREPRELRKPQASAIARPAAKTTSKVPSKTTATVEKSPVTHSPGDAAVKEVASTRGRTLLPQRSNSSRDGSQIAGQPTLPPPLNKPSRVQTSPERRQNVGEKKPATGTAGSAPTRRQSILRPAATRVPPISTTQRSNVSASTKSAISMAPPSPRKQTTTRTPTQPTPRPASPKKTDMPPPPRPLRSASLRQPPTSTRSATGTQASVRGHARHRSQVTPTTTAKPPPDSTITTTAQKAKAPFSTYQQHYSPKKPGIKPPTPTPGSTSSDSLLIPTSWPDIAALQTELLQLSLLHSNSLQRQSDWKTESESRLREKYDGVADQYRSLLDHEKERQIQVNMQALGHWAQNCQDPHGSTSFPEQIHTLSQVLQEVSDLMDRGADGRYSRAVETFESWFHDTEDIRTQRQSGSSGVFDGATFINPLSGKWKEELQSLKAKLDLCLRQIGSLDLLGFAGVGWLEQSALNRVAQGLYECIQLMVQEIHAMRTAEAEIVRLEREMVSHCAAELSSVPRETRTPRVGLWMS